MSADERGLFGKARNRHCPVAQYCNEANMYFSSAMSLECE